MMELTFVGEKYFNVMSNYEILCNYFLAMLYIVVKKHFLFNKKMFAHQSKVD